MHVFSHECKIDSMPEVPHMRDFKIQEVATPNWKKKKKKTPAEMAILEI